jgi:hypothetical protein
MFRTASVILTFFTVAGYCWGSPNQVTFSKMISIMDSNEDVSRWVHREASKNFVIWQFAVDSATQKPCTLFLTPTADQVEYPGMNLPLDQGQPMDIKYYKEFVFEAANIGPNSPSLQLVMLDDQGVARYGGWEIKPGWNTYRVAVPKAFRERKLAQIQFGYDTPKQNYKIYLANLRLENNNFLEDFESLKSKIDTNKSSLTAELMNKFNELGSELKSFNAATENSKITGWLDSVTSLEHAINQHLIFLKIREFDSQHKDSTWGYAWADGTTKVFREDNIFPGTFSKAGEVALAGNEYESIQLVLRSKTKVSNVTVSVSDLTNETNAKISSKDIQILLVGYVNTKRPTYDVDYVGWWPDPLLDFLNTFELDANVWQPVWLDIHTSANLTPGNYSGTITVGGDGVETLKIPLHVKVWKFSVPHEKHLPLALNWWDGSELVNVFESQYASNPEEFQKYKAYLKGKAARETLGIDALNMLAIRGKIQRVLIEHRLNPLRIYNETPPLTSDVKMLKDAGFKTYCILMIWSQRQLKDGDPYPADKKKAYMDMLEEAVPRLKKAGLLEGAYVYGFDECNQNEYAAIADIFGEIKRRWPELQTMTTAYDYTYGLKTGLADVVDIWVPLTPKYDQTLDQVRLAHTRGENIWWYVCVAPEHPYANLFVEYSSAEHRLLMGIMPFKFDSQGFLHYSLNYWKTGQFHTPFKEHLNKGPLTNYDGRSWGDSNGDGLIFYPGDNGPVVTIRMKNMRDGLEDYEYLWMLRDYIDKAKTGKLKQTADWLNKANAAMQYSTSLVESMQSFTQTGADILEARKRIAAVLEEINE